MKIKIITLFPEMFEGIFDHSMLFKARERQLVDIELINLRDYGLGTHKKVDDTPYGGGDGMLLKIEPLVAALEATKAELEGNTKTLLMTPRGDTYNQSKARSLSKIDNLIIVCGRYEGYDERFVEYIDEQVSVGNFVLTGGEIPAMAVVDSVVRLIPGVLGGETSAEIESFSDDEASDLEYPQYTRPEEFRGKKVPDVLLSGNHAEIDKWRQDNK